MPQSTENTEPRSESRRRLLSLGTVVSSVAVAGCLGDLTDTADDDTTDDDAKTDDATNDPDEDDERIAAVDAYLEAAAESDVDRMSDLSHSLHPLDPAEWEADGWEFQGGDDETIPEYETDLTEDTSPDDVMALGGADFWFAEVDLAAELEDADLALVDVEAPETGEGGTWALATEDGEWRILYMMPDDDTPDDPEEAFEDELIDDEQAVVAEIDWDYDQDGGSGLEWAQVVYTDDPGLEAERVRAESVIEGSETEFYDPDGEPGGWADSWATIGLDPDGDQIVVTAINDGEETVVHRETAP